MAGNVSADGEVNKPDSISCARYVRVTDTSNPENFSDETADGYDVDGVRATGEPCTPPTPTPTPGGGDSVCNIKVNQNNTAVMGNVVNAKANTGKNKANKNNGGNTNINTGNANVNINASNSGGSNIANVGGCANGDINATIKGNGAGSTNTININSGKDKKEKAVSKKEAPKSKKGK